MTGYGLRVTGDGLRVTGDGGRVTGYRLRVTGYRLRVTVHAHRHHLELHTRNETDLTAKREKNKRENNYAGTINPLLKKIIYFINFKKKLSPYGTSTIYR